MSVPITAERLREILRYDPVTGEFVWLVTYNSRAIARQRAGSTNGQGYRQIRIDGRIYLAHRLAWLDQTGQWPTQQVDHIDLNRSNNAFLNLREASPSQNGANTTKQRDNICGFKGASPARNRKWQAHIMKDGTRHFLGLHPTPEQAHAAYQVAAERLFGEFARCE